MKILITDSLKPIIKIDGNLLSRDDMEIFFVPSEEDIVKTHRIENVDLIIMELTETGDSMEQVCSIIRNDDALNKVSILFICENNKSAIAKCHAYKANAYITKPVNFEELLRNIIKLLYPEEGKHLRVKVQVLIKGDSGKNKFFANSKDISSSGILIESDRLFEKGERINCSFIIERNKIDIIGQIVRVEEKEPELYDYGIKFINPDFKTKWMIDKFITKSTVI
jgi:DNA-binding response OmpR family regulator